MPGSPAGGHHRAVPRQRAAPTAVPAAHAPRAAAADARVPHLCRRAGESVKTLQTCGRETKFKW